MAHWMLLTTADHKPIRVNMDQVAFMVEHQGKTVLHFGTADGESHIMQTVEESMDRINTLMEHVRPRP